MVFGANRNVPVAESVAGEEQRLALLTELRERAAELDAVIENTDAQLAVLDGDMNFVLVNSAYATASGHSKAELLGRNHFELFPNPENQAIFERVRDTGEPYRAIEKPFQYAGQPWRGVTYWNWLLVPIKSPEGVVERLLFTLTDVTEQVRARHRVEQLATEARERAQQLDTTIAAIADGLIISDADGRILLTNPAAEAILRLTPEQRSATEAERAVLYRPQLPDGTPLPSEQLPALRALRGETVRGLPYSVRPAEHTVWVSASAAPLHGPDGRINGAVTTLTDITALHELQEQREDLLRAVSHDLRSPLTVVLGQAQLLLRQMERAGAGEPQRRGAEAIIAGAQRMNLMIQDLVDSARMEAGQLRLELTTVDLAAFIQSLLGQLAGVLEVQRVRLEAPADLPTVRADPARLERILTNLLSNALKYSPAGSVVTVTLSLGEEAIATAVHDRGPGIAPEDRPRLFQRYGRPADGRGAQPGLGLGLYISRILVEAHGGRIWVESEVGAGSTFYFTLPVTPQSGS